VLPQLDQVENAMFISLIFAPRKQIHLNGFHFIRSLQDLPHAYFLVNGTSTFASHAFIEAIVTEVGLAFGAPYRLDHNQLTNRT
jgi:hypothetical protein